MAVKRMPASPPEKKITDKEHTTTTSDEYKIEREASTIPFNNCGHFWQKWVQKNGTSSARTKIPKIPPNIMELPCLLSVYHFWMGFKSILEY